MDSKSISTTIERQDWLEPTADAVQGAVSKVFSAGGEAGRSVQDFLHGVWLGHPLHPALTDVPIGAWTVAVGLDIMDMLQGKDDLAPGADAAVAVGLVGAVGSAVTGLTDWHVLKEEKQPKKVGLTHALINTTATLLFAGSLVCRKRNSRQAGRALGFLGYAAACAGAFLGGSLVYEDELGVDHAERDLPHGWVAVCEASKLKEGKMMKVKAGSMNVLVAKHKGRIFAIGEVCSHLGGPLSEGKMGDCCVECPWHGSTFSLEDGTVIHGPATLPQPVFATRVNDGMIEVKARRA
jgi:nitrite reductase/ring-hydroxylating ferredoxin subunit/uncharacterized membrane protein